MCGRFTLRSNWAQIAQVFQLERWEEHRPRYNIAPESTIFAVRRNLVSGSNELVPLRWGLIPSWSKDPTIARKLINARGETVAEKPSFRTSFKKRRCLVPATGYYEWKVLPESLPTKKLKQPMYFTVKKGEPFSFAGLWDSWERFDGKRIVTYTIITTEPNEFAAEVHNGMPVILPQKDEELWLEGDVAEVSGLLKAFPGKDMSVYEVSKLVNSPSNDTPDCIAKVA